MQKEFRETKQLINNYNEQCYSLKHTRLQQYEEKHYYFVLGTDVNC